MTATPGDVDALVRSLAKRIHDLESGQFRHARASQAAYRSVEAGSQKVYDEVGKVRAIIGAQEDGTYGVRDYNGDPPPIPSAPILTAGIEAVTILWDGYDQNDELGWPADFARVEVHVSSEPNIVPTDDTQIASFNSPIGGSTTVVWAPGEPLYVVFTSVSTSGAESEPSYESSIEPNGVDPEDPDPTAPVPIPSTPVATARLGVIRVAWDGLDVNGTPIPTFGHLEVHYSTAAGFTPTPGDPVTLLGVLAFNGPGYVLHAAQGAYGTPYYFRFIVVDRWEKESDPSGEATATVTPLVDADAIQLIIDGAQIKDDAIGARHIVASESLTAKFAQFLKLEAVHFSSNLIEADWIDFGTLNGELVTGLQIQTSPNGNEGVKLKNAGDLFAAYDGVSFVPTFRIDAAGNVTMTKGTISGPTFQTADFGTRMVLAQDAGTGGILKWYYENIAPTNRFNGYGYINPSEHLSTRQGNPWLARLTMTTGTNPADPLGQWAATIRMTSGPIDTENLIELDALQVEVSGDLTVGDFFNVLGSATVEGNLLVKGNLTVNGTSPGGGTTSTFPKQQKGTMPVVINTSGGYGLANIDYSAAGFGDSPNIQLTVRNASDSTASARLHVAYINSKSATGAQIGVQHIPSAANSSASPSGNTMHVDWLAIAD